MPYSSSPSTPSPACWPGHAGDDDTNTEPVYPTTDDANTNDHELLLQYLAAAILGLGSPAQAVHGSDAPAALHAAPETKIGRLRPSVGVNDDRLGSSVVMLGDGSDGFVAGDLGGVGGS